ncbi:MotA/TolQ/ExbB proton channel family protein [Nisaea acidiphila]|uniref:MotA/TolQ/ExbB proton channel family protein n=1 Tax=Nisaea acidiphila TaxID=1862145 RepID=A0A9J7AR00_9PROT|nr:MotA/TolQ/ExbB proton channel family protein [Nisaea acidiphila]UUX49009.1 MotA/TolQ/ExbB proton channel family protein [Nisaea acidiphila]
MTSAFDQVWEFMEAGGPIMYLLALLSVLATTVFVSKLVQFLMLRLWGGGERDEALKLWRAGQGRAAVGLITGNGNPAAALSRYAMQLRLSGELPEEGAREEVERVAGLFLDRLNSGLRLLASIAMLSPLIGLLGTVIGMIDAFQALEEAGNKVDPSILSGGIWVALLTTAAGLVVAIPATAAHQLLDGVVERAGRDMEDAVTQVFTAAPGLAPEPVEAPVQAAAALQGAE